MLGVYFLTDGANRSYIGYSTDVAKRIETHRKKKGAKYTRSFNRIVLIAFVTGFSSKNEAMSFEWHAKRRRKAPAIPGMHNRYPSFLATVPYFEQRRHVQLKIHRA